MKKVVMIIAILGTRSVFAGQDSGVGPKGKEQQLELSTMEMRDVLQGAFAGDTLNIQKPGIENIKLRARTFDFQSRTVELVSEDESIRILATESKAQ